MNKRIINGMSKAVILSLLGVVTLGSTNALAKTDSIAFTDKDGKTYEYNLTELENSFLASKGVPGNPALFNDYMSNIDKMAMSLHDDNGYYVNYKDVENAFMKDTAKFNLDTFTENAPETIKVKVVNPEIVIIGEDGKKATKAKLAVECKVNKGTVSINGSVYKSKDVTLTEAQKQVAITVYDKDKTKVAYLDQIVLADDGTFVVPALDFSKNLTGKYTLSISVMGNKKDVEFDYTSENVGQDDVVTIVNRKQLEDASKAGLLVANGKTVIALQIQLRDDKGDYVKGVTGNVVVTSKVDGVKSSQSDAAFDLNNSGIATMNVTLNNSEIEENDTLEVKVTKCSVDSYKFKTATINLKYAANTIGGGGQTSQVTSYTATVQSADLADRVKVYVPGVATKDQDLVKAEILKSVHVISKDVKTGKSYNHELVKVIDDKVLGNGPLEFNHVYTVLLEKEAYASDYSKNVEYALQDNSNNYYTITDSGKNVKLNPQIAEKSFMVVDGELPRLTGILVPSEDKTYLPENTLVAVFSEAVDRATAENPNNWVLNGHNLSEIGMVKSIRELDVQDADDQGIALSKTGAILNDVGLNNRRNAVVIQLTPKAAKYLTKGDNLIQAKSIGDVASVTDHSDNNKIRTQDFVFKYNKPEAKLALDIVKESPEQFVLSTPTMYVDSNANIPMTFCDGEAAKGLTIKLGKEDVTKYFRVVNLADDKYILELKQDWTTIAEIDNTYHNKTLTVTINDGYDVYGTQYDGKTDNQKQIQSSVVVTEDTQSPVINATKPVGSYDETKSKEQNKVIYGIGATAGIMEITMSEPVQLINGLNESPVVGFYPGITQSVEEQPNVPVTNLEYVQLDASGKSTGKIVKGKVVSVKDEHDMTFTATPVSELTIGDWKLVVRSISDDVGNTMKTTDDGLDAAIKFTVVKDSVIVVPTGDAVIDPYVVWSYADDDKVEVKADGTTTINDYVYVLYSRKMDINVLRAATYNINSKQVSQDASITSEDYSLYVGNNDTNKLYDAKWHPELQGQLVTIKLPSNFIVGGDDKDGDKDGNHRKNVLTMPANLKAVDDGMAASTENLLFTNNNDSNQFELSFDTKRTPDMNLPAFTNVNLTSSTSYFNYLKGIIDPKVQEAAEALVLKAETTKLQADIDAAKAAVNVLPEGAIKTGFLERINKIVAVIPVTPEVKEIQDSIKAGLEAITNANGNKQVSVAVNNETHIIDVVATNGNADVAIGAVKVSFDRDTTISAVVATKGGKPVNMVIPGMVLDANKEFSKIVNSSVNQLLAQFDAVTLKINGISYTVNLKAN